MKGKEWEPGTAPRIHVGKRSPALRMLHLNTRVAAQRSLDRMDESDFHYSGALSIDRAAAEKIREILLAAVARMEAPVEEASDEEIHGIAIDFFQIRPFN
jgi:hypothetical protein